MLMVTYSSKVIMYSGQVRVVSVMMVIWNAKFDVVEQYFEVVNLYMTRRFIPLIDIDKLFVILKRRSAHQPTARRTFDLERAKQIYH